MKKKKMSVPTKQELKDEIGYLYYELEKMRMQRDAELLKKRKMLIPIAMEIFETQMKRQFGNILKNIVLEHIDDSGYWFTFELTNDSRRQTYCIRHEEVYDND